MSSVQLRGRKLALSIAAFLGVGLAVLAAAALLLNDGGGDPTPPTPPLRHVPPPAGTRTTTDVSIPAGATRADTLRELQRQTGITVTIPWLPDGAEVTGVRATVTCLPTCTETAQLSVRGPGSSFELEQLNRPTSTSGGLAIPGAPPGVAFSRGEGAPGFVTWTLTNATHTYTLDTTPGQTLEPATALRILLGMAR
ncbi:MAG: hypothetical protein IPG47_04405 [Thermoflexaceae bacterium]|nr:hypothetical protein [Thermoflexaceae bacterium]